MFFLRESDHGGITGIPRLAAAVVAPTLSAATLMKHLRRRIDPVFLPRPLVIVERLPRNATGKLPQQALQALADRRPRRAARHGGSPALAAKPAVKARAHLHRSGRSSGLRGTFSGDAGAAGRGAARRSAARPRGGSRARPGRMADSRRPSFWSPCARATCSTVEHSANADVIRFAVAHRGPAGPRRHPVAPAVATAPMSSDPARLFETPRKRAEWIGNRERGSERAAQGDGVLVAAARPAREPQRAVWHRAVLFSVRAGGAAQLAPLSAPGARTSAHRGRPLPACPLFRDVHSRSRLSREAAIRALSHHHRRRGADARAARVGPRRISHGRAPRQLRGDAQRRPPAGRDSACPWRCTSTTRARSTP